MKQNSTIRNLLFITIAICAFLLKTQYNGPYKELFISYWGNFWISFAVYFIVGVSNKYWRTNDFVTATIAILIVELFELTDGFGVMENVYDPIDLIINIWGVALAITAEIILNVLQFIRQQKVSHTTSDR